MTLAVKEEWSVDERLQEIAIQVASVNSRIEGIEKTQNEMKQYLREVSQAITKMATLEERLANSQDSQAQLRLTIEKMQKRQDETDRKFRELIDANAIQDVSASSATAKNTVYQGLVWLFVTGIVSFVVYQVK